MITYHLDCKISRHPLASENAYIIFPTVTVKAPSPYLHDRMLGFLEKYHTQIAYDDVITLEIHVEGHQTIKTKFGGVYNNVPIGIPIIMPQAETKSFNHFINLTCSIDTGLQSKKSFAVNFIDKAEIDFDIVLQYLSYELHTITEEKSIPHDRLQTIKEVMKLHDKDLSALPQYPALKNLYQRFKKDPGHFATTLQSYSYHSPLKPRFYPVHPPLTLYFNPEEELISLPTNYLPTGNELKRQEYRVLSNTTDFNNINPKMPLAIFEESILFKYKHILTEAMAVKDIEKIPEELLKQTDQINKIDKTSLANLQEMVLAYCNKQPKQDETKECFYISKNGNDITRECPLFTPSELGSIFFPVRIATALLFALVLRHVARRIGEDGHIYLYRATSDTGKANCFLIYDSPTKPTYLSFIAITAVFDIHTQAEFTQLKRVLVVVGFDSIIAGLCKGYNILPTGLSKRKAKIPEIDWTQLSEAEQMIFTQGNLIDPITRKIMQDPYYLKLANGRWQVYDKSTLDALKGKHAKLLNNNETYDDGTLHDPLARGPYDPLTREPLASPLTMLPADDKFNEIHWFIRAIQFSIPGRQVTESKTDSLTLMQNSLKQHKGPFQIIALSTQVHLQKDAPVPITPDRLLGWSGWCHWSYGFMAYIRPLAPNQYPQQSIQIHEHAEDLLKKVLEKALDEYIKEWETCGSRMFFVCTTRRSDAKTRDSYTTLNTLSDDIVEKELSFNEAFPLILKYLLSGSCSAGIYNDAKKQYEYNNGPSLRFVLTKQLMTTLLQKKIGIDNTIKVVTYNEDRQGLMYSLALRKDYFGGYKPSRLAIYIANEAKRLFGYGKDPHASPDMSESSSPSGKAEKQEKTAPNFDILS